MKEASLSALSALAEGSQNLFDPHYDEVINLIFQVFQQSHNPAFKQLVGISIEAITIIAKLLGKEKIAPF